MFGFLSSSLFGQEDIYNPDLKKISFGIGYNLSLETLDKNGII